MSPLKKVRACRRFKADPDAESLPVRGSHREDGSLSVGFGGLQTCACWHSCLGGCGVKLAVHRAQELDHALRVWEAIGGTVVLATFSARHHRGQSLRELVKGQRAGRAAVVSDRPWREDQR